MLEICTDLVDEWAALDAFVADLPDDATGWHRLTPADGWDVFDSIGHLWYFDLHAHMALTDPDAFAEHLQRLRRGAANPVDVARSMGADELLHAWREQRAVLVASARTVDARARVPWYGPAMGARSFITARLMETWAHGQDVFDAFGAERSATHRLRHVVHIGVGARRFSYAVHNLVMPDADVRVVLVAPDGSEWTWGPADASDRITGTALDFCLVVTHRRHVADTTLVSEGDAATEWLRIAQAFAGPPGSGRAAGQFTSR